MPIYPGILLASQITGIPLAKLILGLFPFGILIILLGLPYLFSIKINDTETDMGACETVTSSDANPTIQYSKDRPVRGQLIKNVVFSTLPVIIIVALVLASVNAALAVVIVVGFLVIKHRYTLSKFILLVREALVIKTLVIIWAIMFFKEVIDISEETEKRILEKFGKEPGLDDEGHLQIYTEQDLWEHIRKMIRK